MSQVAAIDNAKQIGYGAEAQIMGLAFDVYRLGADSNSDWIADENKIATAVPVYLKGVAAKDKRELVETDTRLGTFWFDVGADCRPFKVGDVFVQNDPNFGPGYTQVTYETQQIRAFALANRIPGAKAFGGRIDCLVQVERSGSTTSPLTQGGNFTQGSGGALPPVLNAGVGSLGGDSDTASWIPVGLMSTARTYGEQAYKNVPSSPRRSAWYCYVPPIQGWEFREGDRIIAKDGALYTVLVPYVQEVGAVGFQMYLEREAAGPS